MPRRHNVCSAQEIAVGKLTLAKIGRSVILLSRLPSGEIRAFSGRCPHQGADLRDGCISGFTDSDEPNVLRVERPGEILRCPWHGFEFSLVTGEPAVADSEAMPLRLRFYDVEIEGDQVVVVT